MPPDYSSMSNEELARLAGVSLSSSSDNAPLPRIPVGETPIGGIEMTIGAKPEIDYSSLSDEDLARMAGVTLPKEPGALYSLGKGMIEAPGATYQAIKSIPNGLSNIYTAATSPIDSIQSGNTEKVVRGIGSMGAGIAGAGAGATWGGALGAFGGPLAPITVPAGALLGAALGGGAGLLGFDYLNQATGSDAITTGKQDLNKLAEMTGQGITMGVVGKGIQGAAEYAPKLAEVLNRKSIGARQADFAKSAKYKGLTDSPTGETTTNLGNSIEQVRQEGGFSGTRNPVKLLDKNTDVLNTIEDSLSGVLKEADSVNTESPIIPKYTKAEAWIKTQPASEQAALRSALDEIKAAHNTVLDGTLEALQKEKRALYGKTYGESGAAKEAVAKYVASDLKTAIENGVDDLVSQGKLPADYAGTVKALNEKSGVYQEVRPILERRVVQSMTDDPIAKLANIGFTTGGIGAPTIAGGVLGGPVGSAIGAAMGLTGKALTTPTGQALTAATLRGISKPINAILNSKAASAILKPELIGAIEAANKKPVKEAPVKRSEFDAAIKPSSSPSPMPTPIPSQLNSLSKTERIKKVAAFVDEQPPLIKAIIKTESSGDPFAQSPTGPIGLMQLTRLIGKAYGAKDRLDPKQNVKAGTAFLQDLADKYKDPKVVLAAYNQGETQVNKAIKKANSTKWEDIKEYLTEEGKTYPDKVIGNLVEV